MRYKIITLVSLLSLLTNVYAQKQELKGFYKLNFGISENNAKSIIENEPDGLLYNGAENKCRVSIIPDGLYWRIFKFANRLVAIEGYGCSIPGIKLYFYKDQLYTARIPFYAAENTFNEIKSEISEKYFPCDIEDDYQCKWIFKGGNYIQLDFLKAEFNQTSLKLYNVVLTYVNRPISDLKESDRKNENMKFF